MKTIQLGKQGLEVSVLGMGCMGMTTGFGQAKEPFEMIKVIQEGYCKGIRFFDTAQSYQAVQENGDVLYNESLLGEALKDYPRDSYVLASKCGIIQRDGKQVYDASKEVIFEAIEETLERLQTDYLDLYFLHRVDNNTPIETVATTMQELMDLGKIKYWGMSEAPIELVERAHKVCPLSVVENEYSLLCREVEGSGYKQRLEQLGIGFVAYAPLGKAFLTGKLDFYQEFTSDDPRSRQPRFDPRIMEENRKLIEYIQMLASKKGKTAAQIALAWLMHQEQVVPIPGMRKIERIEENIGASDIELTKQELLCIRQSIDEMELYTLRFDPNFQRK
ncbi:aldo/keto reductase [Tannockella kyphosi]|uniref:aldo/keto reductase n=1 Tax=Tannockella kyphosi TaxID=2899121 RepID=UPI002013AA7F|nr:aldo/keto reductase [Tannockella kyphosi]